MKRFINELTKISNKNPVSKSILEASEVAVISNSVAIQKLVPYADSSNTSLSLDNEKKLVSVSATKKEYLDINGAFAQDNNNMIFRVKKSFYEKHSDSEFVNFLAKEDDSYYTKSNVDLSKDNIFTELAVLRDILNDKKLLEQSIVLSKEIILFYSTENFFNGENRGKVLNKKSEMFSDKFKENEDSFIKANLSAEQLSNPITFSGKHKPQVVLHSKLKQINCDSYKNAHEVVVANQISVEKTNFVSY